MLRLHRRLHDGIDLFIRRPDILEHDRVTILIVAQHILFDVETNSTGDSIGHHQRRRCQECLFGVRVNPAIEVTVARQHRGGIQIPFDHFFLDFRVQRTGHAITGGTGKGHHIKALLLQLWQQTGLFQIHFYRLGTGRQGAFHPRLADQTQLVRITGQ